MEFRHKDVSYLSASTRENRRKQLSSASFFITPKATKQHIILDGTCLCIGSCCCLDPFGRPKSHLMQDFVESNAKDIEVVAAKDLSLGKDQKLAAGILQILRRSCSCGFNCETFPAMPEISMIESPRLAGQIMNGFYLCETDPLQQAQELAVTRVQSYSRCSSPSTDVPTSARGGSDASIAYTLSIDSGAQSETSSQGCVTPAQIATPRSEDFHSQANLISPKSSESADTGALEHSDRQKLTTARVAETKDRVVHPSSIDSGDASSVDRACSADEGDGDIDGAACALPLKKGHVGLEMRKVKEDGCWIKVAKEITKREIRQVSQVSPGKIKSDSSWIQQVVQKRDVQMSRLNNLRP